MNYLLTEEEYANLRPKSDVKERDEALHFALEEILRANSHRCIHEDNPFHRNRGYCDDCPVGAMEGPHRNLICARTKQWSK